MKTTFSSSWITALLAVFVLSVHETSSAAAIGETLPLGDSITDGVGGTGGGYRARLSFLLNSSADLYKFVGSATDNATPELILTGQDHHEGHSGYRIEHITTALLSSVGDGSDNGGHWLNGGNGTGRPAIFPDLILLHIGTNDAIEGRTAAEMQNTLQSLLTEIGSSRPNAQVIVASVILIDDPDIEAVLEEYNDTIPGIVAGMGPNFHFLDMHSVLDATDLADGVHPNQTGYEKMADAWAAAIQLVAMVEPLNLAAAASRRSHEVAGNFDINLPLTGPPGIECRGTGTGGIDTLVFTFTNNVTGGTATVTSGTGSVTGIPTFSGNVMSVDLTGVADAQQITVTLSGVTDAYAQVLPDTSVPINVLLGDTTANNRVNSSDITQTKGHSGTTLSQANFRTDVTMDGSINSSDISLVKSRSGNAVP